MNLVIIILLGLLVLLVAVNIFFIIQGQKTLGQKDGEGDAVLKSSTSLLLQQMNELSRTVDQKLGNTAEKMHESLRNQAGESYKVIRDITERLTKLDEANKQVISLGDRIESLQDILKNPKQRGVLGEYYLETLLKNTMSPGSYEMQYNLGKNAEGNGEIIVDAVVFVKDKIIPVDSKFSLENYNRFINEKDNVRKAEYYKSFVNDLKERIKETAKYIKPEKNTTDFAFMFIPHEGIYYDLLVNPAVASDSSEQENILERAGRQYKVIMVSPTSFLAYLQVVIQGLNAFKVEEKTKEIIQRVAELSKHISAQDKFMEGLGKSLGTTVNHYEKAYNELKKMDKDVYRIAEKSAGVEPLKIERPEIE
jgi:DNA recombination protein RmuC